MSYVTSNPFEIWKTGPSRDTLRAFLAAYQGTVYNLCFQVLKHPQEAEDASQKVFLELVEKAHQIRDSEHLKQWLYQTCFYVALSARRTLARRMEHEKRKIQTAKDALHAREETTAETVHEQIARLDDEARGLIIEHYFEQRPLSTLATKQGCSTVAIWKKLKKAKEKLRRSLTLAGFSTEAPHADALLEKTRRVSAPPDFSELILSRMDGRLSMFSLGRAAVKMKVRVGIVAALLMGTGLAGYGVLRLRQEAPHTKARSSRFLSDAFPTALKGIPRSSAEGSLQHPVASSTLPFEGSVRSFRSWEEFYSALRRALYIANDSERWQALRNIGFPQSDKVFERVLQRTPGRKGSSDYLYELLQNIFKVWMEDDLCGPARFIQSCPDSIDDPSQSQKVWTLREILRHVTKKNAARALAFVDRFPEGAARKELSSLVAMMSDPARFAPTVLAMAGDPDQDEALNNLATFWAEADPEQAAQWFSKIPKDEDEERKGIRLRAFGNIASHWAERDFSAALQWARRWPEGEEKESVMEGIIEGGFKGGREQAEKFARELLLADPSDFARHQIARLWMTSDPASATQFLHALSESSIMRRFFIHDAASRWGAGDPAAAWEWARTLPHEGER